MEASTPSVPTEPKAEEDPALDNVQRSVGYEAEARLHVAHGARFRRVFDPGGADSFDSHPSSRRKPAGAGGGGDLLCAVAQSAAASGFDVQQRRVFDPGGQD